jgi:Protein of unknown function (DUF3800)
VAPSGSRRHAPLQHQWLPGSLFLIITGYLDESGTHGDSVATVMGGAMASARQWERFEERFRVISQKFGFTVFHTKKFKHAQGEFRGWNNTKKQALLDAMAEASEGVLMSGATMAVNNAEYQRDYRKTPGDPRKLVLASKYGLCFERCLEHFILEAMKRKHRGSYPSLYVVCESGAANAGDALRVFNEHKGFMEWKGIPMLQTLSFESKDSSAPLMLADFFAHTRWLHEQHDVRITPEMIVPEGSKRARVTAINYEPGALAELKKHWIARLEQQKRRAS